MTPDVWTIGHSTRELDAFVASLASFRVDLLVDVRRFPHSRRHPHFNTDELKRALFARGIRYDWLGMELGGFRKPRPGSPHQGLSNSSFQGYADHMETPNFRAALDKVIEWSKTKRVACMCSESNYKGCHRRLISDALQLLHGFSIHHIVGPGEEMPHEPFHEARVLQGRILYASKPLDEFGPAAEES